MKYDGSQLSIATPALALALGGALFVFLGTVEQPTDLSLEGHRIDDAFNYTCTLITVYFALVVGVMAYCLYAFRERPGHRAHYTHGNEPRHLVLTFLLAASVFVFIDTKLVHKALEDVTEVFWAFPSGKDVVRIEIRAQQFEWHARYPGPDGAFNTADDVERINELHLPVGRPVVFQLRSKDVVHSFFLPSFRLKQDVVPGRTTRMWVQARTAGACEIVCAQLCGLGHYRMRGQVTVEEGPAFDAWVARESKAAAEEYDPADTDANWGWDWEAREAK